MVVLLKFGLFALFTLPALVLTEPTLLRETASLQDTPGAKASPPSDDSDSLVLADGTPILIKVANGFSSENAKAGDVVSFVVAFDVREAGLVIIPQRMGFTGKVVSVSRPHRGARNGRVNVAFDALTLPTGETAAVRSILKPPHNAAKVGEGAATAIGTGAELFITAGIPLLVLFKKGDEQIVPEGTLEIVYLNGPLRLSRKAVMALQPTSASGYANIYVGNLSSASKQGLSFSTLFCGERVVVSDFPSVPGFNWFQVHRRLQLSPGLYWFSTDNQKDGLVRIEVLASREYFVGRKRHRLFAKELSSKDNKQLRRPNVYPSVILDKDLTKLTSEEYRSLIAEPAARRRESGTQHE